MSSYDHPPVMLTGLEGTDDFNFGVQAEDLGVNDFVLAGESEQDNTASSASEIGTVDDFLEPGEAEQDEQQEEQTAQTKEPGEESAPSRKNGKTQTKKTAQRSSGCSRESKR